MPRNGSGTYSLPAGNPVVSGTTISSTAFNNTMTDLGTAITNSIAVDGQSAVTANIPFGGYRATNVGITAINGSVGTPAVNVGDAATGLYRPALNQIAVAVNGALAGNFTSTGLNSCAVGATTASTGAFTTLSASSNLLVGTTSSTAGYALKVGGANANILIQADSPNGATLLCDSSAAGAKGAFFGHVTSVAQAQVRCGASGGVYLSDGATSWAAISDERKKTDLLPITDALVKVNSLRAVTGRYVWDEKRRAFLIAQEVQQVLPEAVDVADDADGTLGLAYTDVIPLLVASIKELNAKVAALEAA